MLSMNMCQKRMTVEVGKTSVWDKKQRLSGGLIVRRKPEDNGYLKREGQRNSKKECCLFQKSHLRLAS